MVINEYSYLDLEVTSKGKYLLLDAIDNYLITDPDITSYDKDILRKYKEEIYLAITYSYQIS